MLPTRLNLLSPKKQKTLRQMIRNEFLKAMLAVLIVVITIVSVSFIGGRSVLQEYFSELAVSLNAITVRSEKSNLLIESANSRISTAAKVLDTYVYWPTLLTQISNTVPDGILISHMQFDNPSDRGTLKGNADTREALLSFGELLRSLETVETVHIPISQLTKKENISFVIQLEFHN